MIILKVIAFIFFGCGFIYWLLQLILTLRVIKSVPLLKNLPDMEQKEWSKVSVVIPARNEADTIEQAVKLRLQDDYPNLEILMINDRSTDQTGKIIDKLAKLDRRIKAIHISKLPEKWLGKLYAMHQGVKQATGDWFLFSDADVHIKPGTIKRAVAYGESRKLDHVAVLPELLPTNFLLDITLSTFVRMICLAGRIWAVEDEKSEAAAGAGAFNLVRRIAFDKTNGFKEIKLESADDVALGRMLRRSGARQVLFNGRRYVSVCFYRSLHEMAVGSERATFTSMGNFSLTRLVLISVIMFGLEMSPFLLLFGGGFSLAPLFGLIMFLIAVIVSILMNKWAHRSLITSFFFPIGVLIMIIMILRAGILGVKRGGVIWRGTFYPTEELRQGRRFKF